MNQLFRLGLHEVARRLREGKLKPLVGATYPLDQAGAAMTALLSRKVAGKIVLEV